LIGFEKELNNFDTIEENQKKVVQITNTKISQIKNCSSLGELLIIENSLRPFSSSQSFKLEKIQLGEEHIDNLLNSNNKEFCSL
jgi:hypothetical protein